MGTKNALAAGTAPASAYRGIRYARSERFGPAIAVPFAESLIGTGRGPVGPQLPFFEEVMGPQAPLAQVEHNQFLSVFTPSRSGRRPVLVFIHGGAFLQGGGELPWYDGTLLAGEQDIVVVNISYRLGAFGFWLPEGSTGLSPGLHDQVVALEWIRDNIAKFGGDPDNVTVSGESAGAISALLLTEWGYGQKLFKRIGAMSGPESNGNRFRMERVSRKLEAALGADPHTAPVAAILQAQLAINETWRPVRPYNPHPINVDALVGWNRDDWSIFNLFAEKRQPQPGTDVARFRDSEGQLGLVEASVWAAHQAAAAGYRGYLYSFDWEAPDTGLGTVHTIDLAFLLGSAEAWAGAPLLRGADPRAMERLGRLWRAQWGAFARSGDPNAGEQVRWTAVSAGSTPVPSFA